MDKKIKPFVSSDEYLVKRKKQRPYEYAILTIIYFWTIYKVYNAVNTFASSNSDPFYSYFGWTLFAIVAIVTLAVFIFIVYITDLIMVSILKRSKKQKTY